MIFRRFGNNQLNVGVWRKVVGFSLVMFFVGLADAILSDWVPEYMQEVLGGAFLMGIVYSFQSIIGFFADLVGPQLLKKSGYQRLVAMAIGGALVFTGVSLWSIEWPIIILFLLMMAVWGIYYEMIGFGQQQFVVEVAPSHMRSSVWGVIGVFRSLAYFLGPLVGTLIVINYGNREVLWFAGLMAIIALVFWVVIGYKKDREVELGNIERPNILREWRHWWVLFGRVWPVLTISLVMGLIDSMFWTTGAVLSTKLAAENWLGSAFLSIYMLPSLFIGFVVAKFGVYKGKKKIAEIFLLFGGVVLSLIGLNLPLNWLLLSVFVMSALLTVVSPMIDAVYTDILARMGKEKMHMPGLTNSTMNIAYIVGPVVAGWITQFYGEYKAFGLMGLITVMVAAILLVVTPKKLRLPQEEIQSWE